MADPAHQKHSPEPVELAKMSYAGIQSHASDQRDPSLKPKRAVLTDRFISRRNLAPDKVDQLLESGAVVLLYRNIRDEIPLIFLFIASLLIVSFISFDLPSATPIVPVQLFAPLAVLAFIFHRRWNEKYFIEKEGITIVKGFLLIHLTRTHCTYDKIKTIEVQKNILQRFLFVGDIRFSTALIDRPELEMHGIGNPYFYIALMNLRVDVTAPDAKADTSSADDAPPPTSL